MTFSFYGNSQTYCRTNQYILGRLQEAQGVIKDAIDTIEESPTARETFCQVSTVSKQNCTATVYVLTKLHCACLMHDVPGVIMQAIIGDLKRSLESMQSRQSYLGHGKLYMHSK